MRDSSFCSDGAAERDDPGQVVQTTSTSAAAAASGNAHEFQGRRGTARTGTSIGAMRTTVAKSC
jgi:hypothetical protein